MVRMDITPYVDRLRSDLTTAAAAGGEQARDAAERLTMALDPALRLTLMEVLSEASAEITSAMRSGSVETRLSGRDIEFVLDQSSSTPPSSGPEPETDEGDLARITVRIPESIKARAEELAAKGGSSLNTWIVNALRNATREHGVNIDIDLSGLKDAGFPFGKSGGSRRMTGWV